MPLKCGHVCPTIGFYNHLIVCIVLRMLKDKGLKARMNCNSLASAGGQPGRSCASCTCWASSGCETRRLNGTECSYQSHGQGRVPKVSRSSMQLGLIAAQLDKSPLCLDHGNFKICKPTGRTKQASGATARCQRVHTHVQPFTPEPKFANFAVTLQTESYASNQTQLPARHMPAMASAIRETGMMPSELLIPERSEKTGPQPLRVMNKILNDPKQSIRPQLLQRRFGLGKSGSWRFHPLLIQGNRRVVKVAVPLYTRRSVLLTSPTPGKITKHAGSSNRVTQ